MTAPGVLIAWLEYSDHHGLAWAPYDTSVLRCPNTSQGDTAKVFCPHSFTAQLLEFFHAYVNVLVNFYPK